MAKAMIVFEDLNGVMDIKLDFCGEVNLNSMAHCVANDVAHGAIAALKELGTVVEKAAIDGQNKNELH